MSQTGKIIAKKPGKTTISATVNGVTAKCVVVVKKPSIKLEKKKLTMYAGEADTLIVEVKGKSQNVKWKSSKPSVLGVDKNGILIAKKAGKAVISATANGVTAKCTVTVKKVYTRTQAEKALKKYVRKNESTQFWYAYDGNENGQYAFWVTFTGPGMKMKYFIDARTGKMYESGPYFGVYEWNEYDKKRLVGSINKYL